MEVLAGQAAQWLDRRLRRRRNTPDGEWDTDG
jgi:hypothetical protein